MKKLQKLDFSKFQFCPARGDIFKMRPAEFMVISKEKPMAEAVLTEKNLEDAFLLYFGEKSEER